MKINDLSTNHNAWLNETKLSKDLKEAYYDRNDYYDARQGGEYGKGMTYTRSGSSSVRGYDRDDALKGQTKHLPADPFNRTTGEIPNKSNKGKVHSTAEGMLDNPGQEDSPVAQAIIRRILLQRTDLLAKHGPEKVGQAVDEVADFVGDVDEIGSSDVSGWVRHVEQMLGNMGEGVAEAGTLDKYRDRLGTTGNLQRQNDRHQEYQDASHATRLNYERNRQRRDDAQTQADIDRMANRNNGDHNSLSKWERDDWDKTFDMMRDRLNRYQWSSQRDVDPEQLAAISNIKYEPRKKNEAVQAKTDDKLLAYYAQRKAEEEKKKKEQGAGESNEFRDEYNSFKG
jgi:hypothetical protein